MATGSEDNFFFYEDEVFRVNSKGIVQFGTVIENSELVSSNDETSDDEYDSSDYKMKKGHIRVSWHPSGLTQMLSESKVGLADRSLMPGDVVKMLAADKNTQRGYCNNIKVYATVQIVGTKQVIENIPTTQLSPLAGFTKDLAVYLDHWVGVIRDVHMKLLIACSDGSKAYISDANTLKALLSQSRRGKHKTLDDDDVPRMGKPDFYPGQALFAPRFILTSAATEWTLKSPEFDRLMSRHKHLKVKVEAVEVDYVEVAWRCSAYTGNSMEPREPIVKGEELKRLCVLNHFESATNQVGDRGTYLVTSEDVVTSLEAWREKKKEKLAEENGRRLPLQHVKRKGVRRKQVSGAPSSGALLNQVSNQEEVPTICHFGDGSKPSEMESSHLPDADESSHMIINVDELDSTLINVDKLDSTLVSDQAQSNSVQLESKCSNETLVPTQSTNEQDVPIILLDVASDSEDCWDTELSTDEDEYYSGDDSTSCCTTDTGTSSVTARTTSESSSHAPQGQDEPAARTTSESSATVAGPGTELTPRPKRRLPTWGTRLSRLRNVKKKLTRPSGVGHKVKAPPCRGDAAEVQDWVGRQFVVEILCTQSRADVVWQDGSTGANISSMDLYPIHYLDEKEFFPGDFVVRAAEGEDEEGGPAGEYGVVKQMDHLGRTARVQWFNITLTEGQSPQYLGESEMSVYDLKDHPDFQFQPGSVVMSMGGIAPSPDQAGSNNASTNLVPAAQSVMSTCDDGTENTSLCDPSSKSVPQIEINGANSSNNSASNPKTSPSPPNVEPAPSTPSGDSRLMDASHSNAVERSTTAVSVSNTSRILSTTSSTNTSESGTNSTDRITGEPQKSSTNTTESATNSTDTIIGEAQKSSTNTTENGTDSSTNNESSQCKPEDDHEPERVYVGQVLDNFPEGRIKVWWVDGSICSVWPQDLYKIGDYNSDEGGLWASSSEGDSWETETETEEDFEVFEGTFPSAKALGLDSDQPLLEELYVQLALEKSALLAALTSTTVNLHDNNPTGTQARDESLPLVNKEDAGTRCDASTDAFHLNLFRTIYRVSHVLDLLRTSYVDKPPLTYSLSTVLTVLTGAYKNLTYLDKLLDTHQFSSAEIEKVLSSMSAIEQLNTKLKANAVDVPTGSKSEVKTGSESEVKTGSKTEVKTGSNPESKTGSESEVKTDSNPESKTSSESEVKTDSNPESKTGSESNGETGSNPERKTYSECKPLVETSCEVPLDKTDPKKKEMVPSTENPNLDSSISLENLDELVSNVLQGELPEVLLEVLQKKFAEDRKKEFDSQLLARMFLVFEARCCALLCSQLLRAHDELIVKFLPHHDAQLGLLLDGTDADEGKLLMVPLYKNKKFQANLKYVKSKLRRLGPNLTSTTTPPVVNESSTAQPEDDSDQVENDLVENVNQSDSSIQSSEVIKLELNHEEEIKKEDDGVPSIEHPASASMNGSSERTPTSGGEPSPDPFNPSVPSCPAPSDAFIMLESVGSYAHKYAKRASFVGPNAKLFFKALRKEMALLRSSLPPGIWVRGFEDRMDLLSVMIEGPARTPYEDGLFHFDLYLPAEFPQSPPVCHYLSYASERLNPNLYETGKVCVSLLGTWSGRGTEVWTPQSTLLQILISIQGLILNAEPYYNEAGYERQRSTTNGQENARMYNEMVVLKLVQAMGALVRSPPRVWATETHEHFRARGTGFTERLEFWSKVSVKKTPGEDEGEKQGSNDQAGLDVNGSGSAATASGGGNEKTREKTEQEQSNGEREKSNEESEKALEAREQIDCDKRSEFELPQFPLLPASRGFCLTLKCLITSFRATLKRLELLEDGVAETLQGTQGTVAKTGGVEELHKDKEAGCNKSNIQDNSTITGTVNEGQIVSENPITEKLVSENPCPSEQGKSKACEKAATHNIENAVKSSQFKPFNAETNTNNSLLKSSNTVKPTNETSSRQFNPSNPSNIVDTGRGKVARSNSREIVNTKEVIGETGSILSRTNSKADIVPNTINKSKTGATDQTRLGTRNSSINRSEMVESIDTIYGSNVISESISVHATKGEGKKKSLDSVNNNNNKI